MNTWNANQVTRTLTFTLSSGETLVLEEPVQAGEDGWVSMPLIRRMPRGMTVTPIFEVVRGREP